MRNTVEEAHDLKQLLDAIYSNGYQPIAIVFYDPKLRLLGLAPKVGVPDAFVEEIGNRLGKVAQWKAAGQA